MPPSDIPVVIAIIAAFMAFIVVVGSVSIWTQLPSSRGGSRDAED